MFSSDSNTDFRDFEVYEGELVAAVAGVDDSFLYAISDASWISLETAFGSKTLLSDDGLFVGSVGILGEDPFGNLFIATAESGNVAAVPEPSTFVLAALAFGLFGCYARFQKKLSPAGN